MKIRKAIKLILTTFLVLFILLNVVICFHAYKFTHFDAGNAAGIGEKRISPLHAMLFGVNNSRPTDDIKPTQPYETVHIASNVLLEGWKIKADSATGTVIIFHGYRASKSQMIDRSDEFLALGYNTLLVDFMGSGGSAGNSTTIGFKEAAEVKAAYGYVAGLGEKHIYLCGTSMGAVSIMKAVNDYQLNADGLILECPFGTMYQTVGVRVRAMGLHTLPVTPILMFWGGLENGFWAFSHNPVDYAKNIKLPVLLMYGEQDNRVSRAEIDTIYNNLQGSKKLQTFPLCGHEDYIPQYHDIWINDVREFLKGK